MIKPADINIVFWKDDGCDPTLTSIVETDDDVIWKDVPFDVIVKNWIADNSTLDGQMTPLQKSETKQVLDELISILEDNIEYIDKNIPFWNPLK